MKIIKVILVGLVGLILLSGLGKMVLPSSEVKDVVIEDSVGNEFTMSEMPEKVVVLSASWGELWQLSGGEIAGVTKDGIKDERLTLHDDVVDVGTIKDPNLEVILSIKPDFVILSEDISSHVTIASSLKEAGISVYVAKVETFEDYLDVLSDFTTLTGKTENYTKYGKDVQLKIDDLLTNLPEREDEPTALFLRAFSTGVKAKATDHVVCDILDDLDVRNIAETDGFPLEDISVEAIMKEDPDYIFVVFMGDEAKAKATLKSSLESNPAWKSLSAVQNNQVIFLSKDLYHYKPNARWAEAYETLLNIIYPEVSNR